MLFFVARILSKINIITFTRVRSSIVLTRNYFSINNALRIIKMFSYFSNVPSGTIKYWIEYATGNVKILSSATAFGFDNVKNYRNEILKYIFLKKKNGRNSKKKKKKFVLFTNLARTKHIITARKHKWYEMPVIFAHS